MPQELSIAQNFISRIARALSLDAKKVEATVSLLAEGGTVPFIARYRKEATGSLDEVAITAIRDELARLIELEKRREAVLKSIHEQGKLTDELKTKILAAATLTVLEDLYLPYKPKKRTRATIAKEKGLEPLAQVIFEQKDGDPQKLAEKFIDEKKAVASVSEALSGARDIIAEWVSEDAEARKRLRALYEKQAVLKTRLVKGKDVEGIKYKDYFDYSELACKLPSHRILAIRRAEKEGIIHFSIQPEPQEAIALLDELFLKADNACARQVKEAVTDSFNRLLSISIETHMRLELKKAADAEAIETFKKNLRELLMAAPMGAKNVLAIDPGVRTGCKVVALNKEGKLLQEDVVYLSSSDAQREAAAAKIKDLVKRFNIEVIAIGNGTYGRESESFVKAIGLDKKVAVLLVDESGASIYSASDVAREEFPDHDITVRGAVSIGRRLMDPLAELVKIDPKSIGVGQYQHDVDQAMLKASLDDIVISCVNQVGVEVNRASKQLLSYVAGLGPVRAQAVVDFRNKHGAFASREDILKVSGFGPKVYEQAAGFLRIFGAANPLDASAVHPERYALIERMAHDLRCEVSVLMKEEALRKKIRLDNYVAEGIGRPTLEDIMQELAKPGRDPREPFTVFTFKEGLHSIDELFVGMELPGVITNVTNFGAFVDIGIHEPGLVHISQLSDKFVQDPHAVVKVHQKVKVKVLEIDAARRRISLSMRSQPAASGAKPKKQSRNDPNVTYTPFKDLL